MRQTPLHSLWAWAICLAGGAEPEVRGDERKVSPERVRALVSQLGDASFDRREAAGRELVAIGEAALPELRAVMDVHPALEVRRRAKATVRVILLNCRVSKSLGLEMCLVEAGAFQMGSPPREMGRRDDERLHTVRITRPLLVGTHEVTQEEFEKVMGSNPSYFGPNGAGKDKVANKKTERFPVEEVTWFDAVAFCVRLSERDGLAPYYRLEAIEPLAGPIKKAKVTVLGGGGYRLPTEAEWEYACRSGTQSFYHFGSRNTGRESNVRSGTAVGYGSSPQWEPYERTTRVGTFAPNLWGLHDMHGNVAEWCGDFYDADYYGGSPENDPPGPAAGERRVVRGGSWIVQEAAARSAARFGMQPAETHYHTGFRVVRSP